MERTAEEEASASRALPRRHRRSFLLAMALLVTSSVALLALNRAMQRSGAGLLDFEFARTEAAAGRIVSQWSDGGRAAARWSQLVDFGFLVAYGTLLTLLVQGAREREARRGRRSWSQVRAVVRAFPVLAAALDAAQNAMLLLVLDGHGSGIAPAVAWVCGVGTLSLAIACVVYAVWVGVRR